jgi:hypothetical protein
MDLWLIQERHFAYVDSYLAYPYLMAVSLQRSLDYFLRSHPFLGRKNYEEAFGLVNHKADAQLGLQDLLQEASHADFEVELRND